MSIGVVASTRAQSGGSRWPPAVSSLDRRIALSALIVLGGLIAAFSFSKSIVLSSVLIFCGGAALICVFAMIQSLVQAITADEMRGRVLSVYNVAFRGGMPIGSLLLGKLIPVMSNWANSEMTLCTRYAAVLVDQHLERNMARAAQMRGM